MPQRKSGLKSLRSDKQKKARNQRIKSELKKELKSLRGLLDEGKAEEAKKKIKTVFQKLDRAATKGLLHNNTSARRKSSLALRLNKLT